MKPKDFLLQNRGMNRSLSISKTGESNVYENINIRITADKNDTLLTVSNERGTKQALSGVVGVLLGWNVLKNHIILFTRSSNSTTDGGAVGDYIYVIEYDGSSFSFRKGWGDNNTRTNYLYKGNLNFNKENPIESVVYYEKEDIQKIYWVDGINVLRFMNFMTPEAEVKKWNDTSFDTTKAFSSNVTATIEKDNSGNTRPNGTIQYLLTYYDKYGSESGYTWISELYYVSPIDTGGSADGTNNNNFKITLTGLDTNFSNYRVYSLFRSSLNGDVVSYLVQSGKVPSINTDSVVVYDNAANQETIDPSVLLYLGSRYVVPGTLAHKDGTLFLGDLKTDSITAQLSTTTYNLILNMIAGETPNITFCYSDESSGADPAITNIQYSSSNEIYPYKNQLAFSSSSITTFKGGEKYRFGIRFLLTNGMTTSTFWLRDVENPLYPVIDKNNNVIRRVVAKYTLPGDFSELSQCSELFAAQLMIAEVTLSDRSVLAQGIVNPTVFNVWERYNKRSFSYSSWIFRPRNAGFSNRHFDVINNSTVSTGEIECNYWTETATYPTPYYQLANTSEVNSGFLDKFDGQPEFDALMIIYEAKCIANQYRTKAFVIRGYVKEGESPNGLLNYTFDEQEFADDEELVNPYGMIEREIDEGTFSIKIQYLLSYSYFDAKGFDTESITSSYNNLFGWLHSLGIPDSLIIDPEIFKNKLCYTANNNRKCSVYYNPNNDLLNCAESESGADAMAALMDTVNPESGTGYPARWGTIDHSNPQVGLSKDYTASYYRQHLMFVDESIVTLNSPEIQYNAVNVDKVSGLKFRIVGVAKMSNTTSDYTVDASHGKLPGKNLATYSFNSIPGEQNIDGLISWPLWNEFGLILKKEYIDVNLEDRESDAYDWGNNTVAYWLHMWNRVGKINAYSDENDSDYSTLRSKIFANERVSYTTIYNPSSNYQWSVSLADGAVRQFYYTNQQFVGLSVDGSQKYYSGNVKTSLMPPGIHKYPVIYSRVQDTKRYTESSSAYLYSSAPVQLTYMSSPHAVISFPKVSGRYKILPRFTHESESAVSSTAIIPWWENNDTVFYNYLEGINSIGRANTVVKLSTTGSGRYVCKIEGTQSALTEIKNSIDAILVRIQSAPLYGLFMDNNNNNYVAELNNCKGIISSGNRYVMIFDSEVIYMCSASSSDTHKLYVVNQTNGNPENKELNVKTGSLGTPSVSHTYYQFEQSTFSNQRTYTADSAVQTVLQTADTISEGDKYLYIGEIYREFDQSNDKRYGGTSDEAKKNCTYLPTSRFYPMNSLSDGDTIYGTEADTYFQRWDCMKTLPLNGSQDGVIEIASVMLETHINLDGRTDNQRGITEVASVDTSTFGSINPVYSQQNNFFASRPYDESTDIFNYPSSVSWTLEKKNGAEIDAWTHITLASSLALDGDKGTCNALRKFNNSLIAFQDRAISEILFNSRTQLSTTNGVPVEIANSGKVDGKRIISDNYGCTNKWSVVAGKQALYFVDSINKAFCAFNGTGVQDISTKLGFDVWFKKVNAVEPWKPLTPFNNFVSFYDRNASDVYLVTGKDNTLPCLVYNENLGVFTSFYTYWNVPMMTNIEDRFVSFKDYQLWLQKEGLFCTFYGTRYPYSIQYRVAPEPYADKIWTNLEYRADFFDVLDSSGNLSNVESTFIDGGYNVSYGKYLHNETFDSVSIWNEYQRTGEFGNSTATSLPQKKFRIWRFAIPRALPTDTNVYGMDRIRNPWINILFKKSINATKAKYLMQMHDVIVRYFE